MIVLIPMAGEGRRFAEAGYTLSKPAIPTTSCVHGRRVPMVVAATECLPGATNHDTQIVYVERSDHQKSGLDSEIKKHFPKASFIVVEQLTRGQASTCLLARPFISGSEELLIAGCDNGMVFEGDRFEALKQAADAVIFTFRDDPAVLEKPNAYGWVVVGDDNRVSGMSVKKALSDTPMQDHAVVATFWFKQGRDFVRAADRMIEREDLVNGEFYVDQVMQHAVDIGLDVRVFQVERYLCWGTPQDYENYEATLAYWRAFHEAEGSLR
jgi:dTDP-glucose pyrophosphorylase